VNDELQEQVRLLDAIERWTWELALPIVRERVERLLDTDPKKRAYEAMDGTRSVSAIEKDTGVNHNDIAAWSRTWVAQRVVSSDNGRPRALYDLDSLDIPRAAPRAAKQAKPAKKAP